MNPSRVRLSLSRITQEISVLMEELAPDGLDAPVVSPSPPATSNAPPATPQGLTAALRRVLAGCTAEPQHLKKIARKLGRKPGNHLRRQLRLLWEMGLVEKRPGPTYRLPDRATKAV